MEGAGIPGPSGRPHWIRRTRFLVYPRFQLALIALNTVVTAAIFGVVWLQASRSFGKLVELGHAIRLAPDHSYFQFVEYQAGHLYSHLAIAFVVGIGISCIATLLLSHRLAGPIVRLRGYFREIARAGEPKGKLSFRKGDFFDDLPGAVNEALSRLAEKRGES